MLTEDKSSTGESLFTPGRSRKTSLAEVKQFMEQHYGEPLSIGQLAELANISPKYFVDLFKKTYGRSAMDYLTDLRMNRAKRYLAETDGLLRDIAMKVGYRDEFYFSRKFKKEMGMSPSDYAKGFKRRIASCSTAITGHLLALNVIPAAAPLHPKWTPYYYHAYRSQIPSHLKLAVPYTDWTFGVNLDLLAHARPDAIIGSDCLIPADKSKLMDIAPCLLVPAEADWRDQLRMIAQFLKKDERAELWIRRYEGKVQSARMQLARELGSDNIILLRIYEQHIYSYRSRGVEEVLFGDLRLKTACRTDLPGGRPLALASLAELNPDRIIVAVCSEMSSRRYWLALQHSAEWRQLEAAKNGHVYTISSDPWFEYSAAAVMRMLDEALFLFTGNCPDAFPDNIHGEFCET